jgi:cytochrome d ubiquinol oxidase subunit I
MDGRSEKNIEFHTKAFRIAAIFACTAAVFQPLSGDYSAKMWPIDSPQNSRLWKGCFMVAPMCPFSSGIPDPKTQTVSYGFEFLAC